MHIIVTGATGFVGRPLVRRLLAAGHAVTALTRDVNAARRVMPVRCACVAWNPAAPLDPAALRDADAIIHLAGAGVADKPWTAQRKQAIRESRVGGSRALVQALRELSSSQRPRLLISASAIGYYGDRGDAELDEQASVGDGFLAEVCQAWEREVFEAQRLNVRTAVIRIGIVLGKDGGALGKMLPPFRLGVGGRMGSGNQWMSWIHLDDLVALFLFALTRAEVSGPINGVAPNAVTNATFTSALAAALRRPALMRVPAVALRLAFGEMSTVLLGSQRVLPRVAAQLGFAFQHAELAGALADLCADGCHEVEYEQWVRRPVEDVCAFFADAHNLERITPDFVHFRIVNVSTPELRTGTTINYRLSLHGVPLRWQSRITEWDPPRRFVDVQTRGPYRLWEHTHELAPHDGGTVVRDRVRYALPFGVLGDLIAGRLVARDVRAIFDFRRESIARLFERY
ncbi:MAG TPA: TIGR01777 family oxidoreductase [Candidatus Acidoferrales bacterium]|nr:TIGR01777 family oxidoreductase [Candidatus Acidoferrales bacterium]